MRVEKGGLKEITREGFEYELTANLEMDTNHNATASKDRTGLFMGKPAFVPTIKTGELIAKWCSEGEEVPELDVSWYEGVEACNTQKELVSYYNTHRKDVDADPRIQKIISDRRAAINSQTQTA